MFKTHITKGRNMFFNCSAKYCMKINTLRKSGVMKAAVPVCSLCKYNLQKSFHHTDFQRKEMLNTNLEGLLVSDYTIRQLITCPPNPYTLWRLYSWKIQRTVKPGYGKKCIKVCSVFSRLDTGVIGSNPTQVMNVCLNFLCVCPV